MATPQGVTQALGGAPTAPAPAAPALAPVSTPGPAVTPPPPPPPAASAPAAVTNNIPAPPGSENWSPAEWGDYNARLASGSVPQDAKSKLPKWQVVLLKLAGLLVFIPIAWYHIVPRVMRTMAHTNVIKGLFVVPFIFVFAALLFWRPKKQQQNTTP